MGRPISKRIRRFGFSNLLAVGNLDRGWLVALLWTRAEGEIKMLARFGTVFYWCSLAIAFACWTAAIIILMAIIEGKLSGSEVWMAAEFFRGRGGRGQSRGGFSFMKHVARWLPRRAGLYRNDGKKMPGKSDIKITFGEMRESGIDSLLVHCSDFGCSH